MDSTRASLLDRVRDLDDHAAWRGFERTYRELILRYARRRGQGTQDAEDTLQTVMLNLAKRLPGFAYDPSAGRFRAYLRRIVDNEIRRQFARQEAGPVRLGLVEVESSEAADTNEELWEEEWTRHHFRQAFAEVRAHLSEQSLAVFDALRGGAGVPAVMERFALTQDAVYKIKQRVRDRLRAQIERQVHDEEFRERRG